MSGFSRLLVCVLVIGVLGWCIRSTSSAVGPVARSDSIWTRTLVLRDVQSATIRSQHTTSAGNVVRTPVAERAVAERVAPSTNEELLQAKIDSALADARTAARDGDYTTVRRTLGWVGRTLDSASGSSASPVIATLRAQRDSVVRTIHERCEAMAAPRNARGSPVRPPCP
jgi:hypothetical protein